MVLQRPPQRWRRHSWPSTILLLVVLVVVLVVLVLVVPVGA
jgi:hypothetical protein